MKTVLVDAVHCFIIEKGGDFGVFEDMRVLLDKYTNPKIILTGADEKSWNKYKLDEMPYPVFTLKHNPEKIDPKYYRIMLQKFNLASEDVIYFEHDPEAVKSAQISGIKTFYYDNAKKNLETLKGFLDKNL